jgi:hypothetical protein
MSIIAAAAGMGLGVAPKIFLLAGAAGRSPT